MNPRLFTFGMLAALLVPTGPLAGQVLANQAEGQASAKVVKVFVLAGQSNMVGHAPLRLIDHQATAEKTRAFYAPWREEDGWRTRGDVWIAHGNRRGKLTVGFGAGGKKIGPELEFGRIVGDHFREPVLLVKTAWGGRAIQKGFRPPSAASAEELIDAEHAREVKNTAARNEKRGENRKPPTREQVAARYGATYRDMIAQVETARREFGTWFPELRGRRFELAGFVWFQGWNDQYEGAEQHYAENLAHLIRDVRRELKAPGMPVVIGKMGQNGSKPAKGAMKAIQEAQSLVAAMKEWKGTVRAIETAPLVDRTAEQLYPEWRKRKEEWDLVGGDHPYHYFGSGIWYGRIGKALAEATIQLQPKR